MAESTPPKDPITAAKKSVEERAAVVNRLRTERDRLASRDALDKASQNRLKDINAEMERAGAALVEAQADLRRAKLEELPGRLKELVERRDSTGSAEQQATINQEIIQVDTELRAARDSDPPAASDELKIPEKPDQIVTKARK